MPLPKLTPLGSEIFLVKDALDPAICQHILEIAKTCEFDTAGILVNTVDNSVRQSDVIELGGSEPLLYSTNQLLFSKLAIVQTLLFQTYGVKFPYAEPCSILRYREGQFYKRHVDNILLSSRFQEVDEGIPTRDISVVGYLNDGFEGGETYFDRQDIKVRPEAGAILVFPAYFTHPHESLPVTKGEKYAFTSWLFH
ncbi:iron-regulated protein [filamentous cyanobacterium CCP1]|nr:iron-regulated protein [filamentous cyanobacterium CCP2]PSB62403.1 iron-regulated protein [filamentous cyanobacterium CCP1]